MTADDDRTPPDEPASGPTPDLAPVLEPGPPLEPEPATPAVAPVPTPAVVPDPSTSPLVESELATSPATASGPPSPPADAVPPASTARERTRRGRGWVYLAWAVALLALVALLAVGVAALTVAGEAAPAHGVVEARFTMLNLVPHSPSVRASYEMWFDPTRGRVRLALGAAGQGVQTVYYWRDSKGAWYIYGRRSARGSLGYLPLTRLQQPALLAEDGIRRAFALLLRHADPATVSRVALRGRVVTAFVTNAVTWPFRADGPTRVWLDDATGLPLQYRSSVKNGPDIGSAITTLLTSVDSLRTVRSTTLPSGFMQPPNTNPSPWERLLQFMRGLMQRRAP